MESHDPGTAETPTGVPPSSDEHDSEHDEREVTEIDDQPQAGEDADSGEPEAGGAADESEESETPDTSGT